eukprot:SAG31_NODE_623_length_13492_cov_62.118196_4_plen_92_part_00
MIWAVPNHIKFRCLLLKVRCTAVILILKFLSARAQPNIPEDDRDHRTQVLKFSTGTTGTSTSTTGTSTGTTGRSRQCLHVLNLVLVCSYVL